MLGDSKVRTGTLAVWGLRPHPGGTKGTSAVGSVPYKVARQSPE